MSGRGLGRGIDRPPSRRGLDDSPVNARPGGAIGTSPPPQAPLGRGSRAVASLTSSMTSLTTTERGSPSGTSRAGSSGAQQTSSSSGEIVPARTAFVEKFHGQYGKTYDLKPVELEKFPLAGRPPNQPLVHGVMRGLPVKTNHFLLNIANPRMELHVYSVFAERQRADGRPGPLKPLKVEENAEVFWSALKAGVFTPPNVEQIAFVQQIAFDNSNLLFTTTPLDLHHVANQQFRTALKLSNREEAFELRCTSLERHTFDFQSDPYQPVSLAPSGTDSEVASVTPARVLDVILGQRYSNPYFLDTIRGQEASRWFRSGLLTFHKQTTRPGQVLDVGLARELYNGFYFSSGAGPEGHIFVNFDRADAVFMKSQPLLDLMCDVFNSVFANMNFRPSQLTSDTNLHANQRTVLLSQLKGLTVKTNHLKDNRFHKIMSVSEKNAHEIKFAWKGEEVSIYEYFRKRYNRILLFPGLPLVETGTKNRPAYYPLEYLELEPRQKRGGNLNEDGVSKMIRFLCKPADERRDTIMKLTENCQLARDPITHSFGIQVDFSRMMSVEAKKINPPPVLYKESRTGSTVAVSNGAWETGRSGAVFLEPSDVTVDCFAVILTQNFPRHLYENLGRPFEMFAKDLGLKWAKDAMQPSAMVPANRVEALNDAVKACITNTVHTNRKLKLIFVLMGGRSPKLYAEVKRMGDTVYGIPTQCLLRKTLDKFNPTTAHNILMKLNVKLGGVNHSLPYSSMFGRLMSEKNILLLGIDVSHPQTEDRLKRAAVREDERHVSVASVVGSVDKAGRRYQASVRVQQAGQEIIRYFVKAVQERIEAWRDHNGRLPDEIYIYRDGVGDTLYERVLGEEIQCLEKAFAQVDERWKPKILLILTNKHHHVRMFCENQRDKCGKSENVPPGTVVDSKVVRPKNFDFYMVSHFGIQGTSRPTYYLVLRNETDLGRNEVEMLTYELCHIYARCPRSVSIPAPVYYADLAAERGRAHIQDVVSQESKARFRNPADHTVQGVDGVDWPIAEPDVTGTSYTSLLQSRCTVHDELKNSLYFC